MAHCSFRSIGRAAIRGLVAILAGLLLAGCTLGSSATLDPVGTEVAIRVAADATLTAQAPPPDEIAFQSDWDGNWEIYLARGDGSAPRNLTQHPAHDTRPAWSPDGERLAFASDREPAGVYVMAADGTTQELLYAYGRPVQDVAWSPDGDWVAVALGIYYSETEALWLIPVAGGEAVRLAEEWPRVLQPAWSPDGTRLAFIVGDGLGRRLAVADAQSGAVRVIAQMSDDITSLAWSPDGRRIAFTAGPWSAECPFLTDAEGGGLEALHCPEGLGVNPVTWYPDGSALLALVIRPAGQQSLERLDLAGGGYAPLARARVGHQRVIWSPDGRRVAVSWDDGMHGEVCAMDVDGGACTTFASTLASVEWPVWRPRR